MLEPLHVDSLAVELHTFRFQTCSLLVSGRSSQLYLSTHA